MKLTPDELGPEQLKTSTKTQTSHRGLQPPTALFIEPISCWNIGNMVLLCDDITQPSVKSRWLLQTSRTLNDSCEKKNAVACQHSPELRPSCPHHKPMQRKGRSRFLSAQDSPSSFPPSPVWSSPLTTTEIKHAFCWFCYHGDHLHRKCSQTKQ